MRRFTVVAVLAALLVAATAFAFVSPAGATNDGTRPPIATPPPAGDTEPPAAGIVPSHDPTTTCGGWSLQSMYGDHWPTESTWWEYQCVSTDYRPAGDYWVDYYYWDGSSPVFYGQWYEASWWDYEYYSDCYWWDEATIEWYGIFSCTDPNPGLPPNVAPTAAFTVDCSGLSCTFDGSGSSDADGGIVYWDWDFGDASSAGGGLDTVEHTFRESGSYSVALTVWDSRSGTDVISHVVTVEGSGPPPNAAPTAKLTVVCSGLSCTFDSSGSSDSDGTIGAYGWNFGDGTGRSGNGNVASVQHVYSQPGTYTVGLTVTDDRGASGTEWETLIVEPPNAAPSVSYSLACSGLTCSFDGRGSVDPDGTIVMSSWDFGDGTTGSGPSVTHVYPQLGTYTVTLTVTDNGGATGTDSKLVRLIRLTARGYKVNGRQKVDLSWSGSGGANFNVYRNGVRIATIQSTAYTDNIDRWGGGRYVYEVCAVTTSVCSNETTVTF